jgi:hypothetical protein
MSTHGAQWSAWEIGRRRLDALKAGRDQIGRLLCGHHSHIDFGAENRCIELYVRIPLVGYRAQFAVDDLGNRRHLRGDGVELIAAGDDDLVRGNHRGLPHAARQLLFAPVGRKIAETVKRRYLANDLRMSHVVVIKNVVSPRFVDFQPGQALVHVHDKIEGVVFTAGPFVETKIPLLLDDFRRRATENGFTLLRG